MKASTRCACQYDHADRLVLAQQRHAERGALAGQGGRFTQRVFGIGHDIEDLNRAPLDHGAAGDGAAVDGQRVVLKEIDIGLGIADGGSRAVLVAHTTHDEGHVGVAEQRRSVDERIEHRLQVEGRAADGLEHVADRGLLLQRFAQLFGACLHLVEQSDVLDRDHGLVGEHLEQADVLFGERAGLRRG